MNKPKRLFPSLVLSIFLVSSCSSAGDKLPSPAEVAPNGIKNVVLIVADGMGFSQLGLALLYAKLAPHSQVKNRKLNIEELAMNGETGIVNTYPINALVADSASSASQYATGKACYSETLGLDSTGEVAVTILERAQELGKSTGLVSDTRITHATPAAFAVHLGARGLENEIADKLLQSNVDLLLSGGLRHFIPKEANDRSSTAFKRISTLINSSFEFESKRTDSLNLLAKAKEQGYELAFDRKTLADSNAERILGLFSSSSMPDGITYRQTEKDPGRRVPTLLEMTKKALEVLAKNPRGFFAMIEAGQIDWACSQNDVGNLLQELLLLDEVVGYVASWAKSHPDTLIVLLSDHESGGFGISYSAYDIPGPTVLKKKRGESFTVQPQFNFASPTLLDKFFNQRKSLSNIVTEFGKLPQEVQTPDTFTQIVNTSLEFPITVDKAMQCLTIDRNSYYRPNHKYLSEKFVARINDFPAFYPYYNDAKAALIGRAIAEQQSVVWSTGTHTAQPVPIIAVGPSDFVKLFGGLHHSTEIGQIISKVWESR